MRNTEQRLPSSVLPSLLMAFTFAGAAAVASPLLAASWTLISGEKVSGVPVAADKTNVSLLAKGERTTYSIFDFVEADRERLCLVLAKNDKPAADRLATETARILAEHQAADAFAAKSQGGGAPAAETAASPSSADKKSAGAQGTRPQNSDPTAASAKKAKPQAAPKKGNASSQSASNRDRKAPGKTAPPVPVEETSTPESRPEMKALEALILEPVDLAEDEKQLAALLAQFRENQQKAAAAKRDQAARQTPAKDQQPSANRAEFIAKIIEAVNRGDYAAAQDRLNALRNVPRVDQRAGRELPAGTEAFGDYGTIFPEEITAQWVGDSCKKHMNFADEVLKLSFNGQQLEALERYREANEALQLITALASQSPLPRAAYRIVQLEDNQKHDQALEYLRACRLSAKIMRLREQSQSEVQRRETERMLARMRARQAAPEQNEDALAAYDRLGPTLKETLQSAVVAIDHGNSKKGMEAAQQLLAALEKKYPAGQYPDGHPGIAAAHLLLAAGNLQLGDLAKAGEQIAYADDFYAFMQPVFSREAQMLRNLQQGLQMRQLAKRGPAPGGREFKIDPNLFARQGKVFSEQLRHTPETIRQEAQARYEKLLKERGPNDPNTIEAAYQLGLQNFFAGNKQDAETYLGIALEGFRRFASTQANQDACALMLSTVRGTAANLPRQGPFASITHRLQQESLECEQKKDYAGALRARMKALLSDPATQANLYVRALAFQEVARAAAKAGKSEEAIKYYEKALEAAQQDVAQAAIGHSNPGMPVDELAMHGELAWQWARRGETGKEKALECLRQAQAVQQTAAIARFEDQGEAALARLLRHQTALRSQALTIGQQFGCAPTEVYGWLWPVRGAGLKTVVGRHMRWASFDNPQFQELFSSYLHVRRNLTSLIFVSEKKLDDKRRSELELRLAVKDRLEHELIQWSRADHDDAEPPLDLHDFQRHLPLDTAVIDFVCYDHLRKEGAARQYIAFVFLPGNQLRRVSIGPGEQVDQAVDGWLAAIKRGAPDSDAAAKMRDWVWLPIQRLLPKAIKRIVIVPEAKLQQIPWCALPDAAPNSVLLERYRLVMAPSTRSLAANAQTARAARAARGGDHLLLVGDVDYGTPPAKPPANTVSLPKVWEALAGTATEIETAETIFREGQKRDPVRLARTAAIPTNVATQLKTARWAVLATHGFFTGPDAEYLDPFVTRQQFDGQSLISQYPLMFSSLVLSGANLPRQLDSQGAPQGDGGLLSAESVAALPLENLELAVLSACESGTGHTAEGEGLAGLQRAFHLAGARQVVGTLWSIGDEPTVAVMTRFYHNLWAKGLAAESALREAQLFVYKNPQAIPQLARSRGLSVDIAKVKPTPGATSRATTHQWAPFMLSTVVLNPPAEPKPVAGNDKPVAGR